LQEVLIRNHLPGRSRGSADDLSGNSSSSSSNANIDGNHSKQHGDDGLDTQTGSSSSNSWQQQQQQPPSMQVEDFVAHSAAGVVAVAVRTRCRCSIQILTMNNTAAAAAAAAATHHHHQQQQQQRPPVVVLRTRGADPDQTCSESSMTALAGSSTEAAAAAAALSAAQWTGAAEPAAVPVAPGVAPGAARLSWVLELDDPTLVLHLRGSEGSAAQPWLVLEVSSITTPTSIYYVNLLTQQQVKVRAVWLLEMLLADLYCQQHEICTASSMRSVLPAA
jgi:hypothetical protein